jgi:protein-S-isoprenylcysteine O-methyltransferase Ste14
LFNYDFLPVFIRLPSHFMTSSLLPFFISIPLGLFIVIVGLLMRRPSGGFGPDVESYLYLLYPEKGNLITDGIYRYIRHPRYLGRGLIAIGFGVLANSIIAVLVGLIHFLIFSSLIYSEDKELFMRFGDDFKKYKKRTPALLPKYGNFKDFARYVFIRGK